MTGLLAGTEAGCARRENPKCCTGRKNECVEYSVRRTVCYCDTYCEKTGDCCEDYRAVCHISAIDCDVSPWGPWSECSSPCGIGSRERTRQVIVPPRNGGMQCPDLKQHRGCLGHNPQCGPSEAVARILPSTFKRDFRDPWRRPHMVIKQEKPSYCVNFRLKHMGGACHLQLWTSHLVRERLVCVECQVTAMGSGDRCVGDGLHNIRTFWTAASVPGCQGSWVQESFQEACSCPLHSLLFI